MKFQILTKNGTCYASLKTEKEVNEMRAALDNAHWLPDLHRWLDLVKDPSRFKLILLLYSHKQLCVCDLANILKISSSAISQHLRKLKDMDLVCVYRHKQTLFYELKEGTFLHFLDRILPEQI